ncbi:MAG TPA: enolase C-terminal domain-like protein [Acidimicrobiales bacterium]|nr:enolase C-terminal domain-like protein [Acidimicrobiales bacterium]
MPRITGFDLHDVRFPTSRTLDGSDAMNPSPDYAAAYVVVRTDAPSISGHAFVFTIGRGNDVQIEAIRALEPLVSGLDLDAILDDLGGLWRRLVGDSQLRWLGPEKGVMHMAIGAVVNACWDLAAKRADLPLWRLLAGLSPDAILDLVDFRYLTDALSRAEARQILVDGEQGRAERVAELEAHGYAAYTTSPGWLGYTDERLVTLLEAAVKEGFSQVKLKVGADLEDDVRRCELARSVLGAGVRIALDANQVWDVGPAIAWVRALSRFDLAWIEEPTSPDDVLGTATIRRGVAPVPVAAGEHVANRVVFKQLLQAGAIDVMQIDACRVAGVNENIANLLLAAKFGVPVCPHAGGVGLCEAVQHLSFFDYAAVSCASTGRMIEWIDHLHEHFLAPASVSGGRYAAPVRPGASTEMRAASLAEFAYPEGPGWSLDTRSPGPV